MSDYSKYHSQARYKARLVAVLVLLKLNYRFPDGDNFPYHGLNPDYHIELSLWVSKTAPKCTVFAYDPGATPTSGGYYINTAFYCAYFDGFTPVERTFLENANYQLYAELHDLCIHANEAAGSVFFVSSKHKKVYQQQEEIVNGFLNK